MFIKSNVLHSSQIPFKFFPSLFCSIFCLHSSPAERHQCPGSLQSFFIKEYEFQTYNKLKGSFRRLPCPLSSGMPPTCQTMTSSLPLHSSPGWGWVLCCVCCLSFFPFFFFLPFFINVSNGCKDRELIIDSHTALFQPVCLREVEPSQVVVAGINCLSDPDWVFHLLSER